MVRVASRAADFLQESGADDVVGYVRSQVQADGGFRGRSSASDLYYTFFGGSALVALNRPPRPGPVRKYLETFGDGETLDFVHAASCAQCWAALPYPLANRQARRLLRRLEAFRATDGGYSPAAPGAARGSVYGGFLAFLSYEMTGDPLPRQESLLDSVRSLQTADGGYANAPEVPVGTTTATAAAVLLRQWLADAVDSPAVAALGACECPTGGFRASAQAPSPDLLSTATALYALRKVGSRIAIAERHLEFVERLWDDSGGFRGHPADPVTDCEYTFYALLALGCLHAE